MCEMLTFPQLDYLLMHVIEELKMRRMAKLCIVLSEGNSVRL